MSVFFSYLFFTWIIEPRRTVLYSIVVRSLEVWLRDTVRFYRNVRVLHQGFLEDFAIWMMMMMVLRR